MKKVLFSALLLALLAAACGQEQNSGDGKQRKYIMDTSLTATVSYGEGIFPQNAKPAADVRTILNGHDSISTMLVGEVTACCQEKGCWMNVDIGNGEQMRVTFKDYAWFIPKNSAGREAVFQGFAHKSMVSVEDQKHFAADAGKPQAEIDAITEPKAEITFEASGLVLRPKSGAAPAPAQQPAEAAPAQH